MGRRSRVLAALAVVPAAAIISAPAGLAAPHCTTTAPNTTQCQTGGSTAIVTSPRATNYGPWYGPMFGFGGVFIGW